MPKISLQQLKQCTLKTNTNKFVHHFLKILSKFSIIIDGYLH